MRLGDFIIYVDESGDHSLASIDPDYPVFVLSFCIFRKADYVEKVVPQIQALKFKWFGHDLVVLHENEIVRRKGRFTFLQFDGLRHRFLTDVNDIIAEAPVTVVSAVIRKEALLRRYARPQNPYQLALLFCLEKAHAFLTLEGAASDRTHVICEARSPRASGKFGREDEQLAREFELIVSGKHPLQPSDQSGGMPNFELMFASKQANSSGLQIADLFARPIGLSVLRPTHQNRAFDFIKQKIWSGGPSRKEAGYGLKVFPHR